MRYGSVCSGIEAASVAWAPLGWKPAFFAEVDAFPRAVLAARHPGVPVHGDFTTIGAEDYGAIDLLVGGTPCQSFSVAGGRAGLDDDRGKLALEYILLADRKRPRWVAWENVPGVFSAEDGEAFRAFISGLVRWDVPIPEGGWSNSGVCAAAPVDGAYGVAWRVLDAQYCRTRQFPWAVPQRRRRVFVVGYTGDWRPAAAVLLERESLCGHPAPRREARQADPRASGVRASGGECERLIDVSTTLVAAGQKLDWAVETFLAEPVGFAQNQRDEVQTMAVSGALAAEPGMKQTTYVAEPTAFSCKDYGADAADGVAPTLRAMGHDGSHANAGGQLAVAFQSNESFSSGHNVEVAPTLRVESGGQGQPPAVAFQLRGRDGGAQAEVEPGAVSPALRASEGGSTRPFVAFGISSDAFDRSGEGAKGTAGERSGLGVEADISQTLRAKRPNAVASPHDGWRVRRLTPRECERLQGFPEIHEQVKIIVCAGDRSLPNVNAGARCTTAPSNACSAGAGASIQLAQSVGSASSTNQVDQESLVALHVLLDCERGAVQIRSQGRCLWSASIAETPSASPLSMPLAAFVHLLAHTTRCAAKAIPDGMVVSQRSTSDLGHQRLGSRSVTLFGREIAAHADVVEKCISDPSRFSTSTTSPAIPSIPTSALMLTTACCSVLRAIDTFIQQPMQSGRSFSLLIETHQGYTLIPWRNGEAPDGPRYKALGNSMAVNVMQWIGERIELVERIKREAA